MPNPIEKVKLKDAEGAQVYPEIDPSDKGTEVVANPTIVGTETVLTGLEINGTIYRLESGAMSPAAQEELLDTWF